MPRPLPDCVRIDWPPAAADPPAATEAALDRAAEILRGGGLVAFPTETVYGVGADALDAAAVAMIFRAKGRPATNPVIVHVADIAMARGLAAAWPVAADRIAAGLWPGPVTIVVPKTAVVPDIVTAGGPTVGLRCPDQRGVRRLIEKVGRPLAAPSANRSEAVSPTTAQHVLDGLGGRVDLILDGGPCGQGIESTVVDCTTDPPVILRPGPLSCEQLETIVGGPVAWPEPPAAGHPGAGIAGAGQGSPSRAPGQLPRHYAPQTPLEMPADPRSRVATLLTGGDRVGWLALRADTPDVRALAAHPGLVVVPMPDDPAGFARVLYATLHALDRRDLDRIIVDPLPPTEAWRAIRDRLLRAATVTP
jgi:L-threonylcarbamoyladenylate synthase